MASPIFTVGNGGRNILRPYSHSNLHFKIGIAGSGSAPAVLQKSAVFYLHEKKLMPKIIFCRCS
ncbi:MAG: hypothetical protein SFZ02_00550 [bacterium]|nr:hypothetical protein [bacterium]